LRYIITVSVTAAILLSLYLKLFISCFRLQLLGRGRFYYFHFRVC